MDALEETLNAMNDNDTGWWPFTALKPDPDQKLDDARVGFFALAYGALFGVLFNFAAAGFGYMLLATTPWIAPVAATLTLFMMYRFMFAWAWNRRAARLAVVNKFRRAATPATLDV